MEVVLDGHSLTIEKLVQIARFGATVKIDEGAMEKVKFCRDTIEDMVNRGETIYGVTTGIGEFARIRISIEQAEELQKRIVYSHAAATGDPQPEEVVRGCMVNRINVLCKGHSGVRPLIIETMVAMLNKGVTPKVYEKGSVGTSGDLAPQSHIAEVVMGEGKAYLQGKEMSGADAMKAAGIEPVVLSYKEGLGIINGPQMMTAGLALLAYDAKLMAKNAIIAGAMTIDALKVNQKSMDHRVHELRGYPGQIAVAANIRKLVEDSDIINDTTGVKVQDGYSLRCTPQVQGPSLDTINYVAKVVETELNALSDNPLFMPHDDAFLTAGNFHGQGVGFAADFLCVALAELADLSERHTNRLLNPTLSGLPDFLVEGKGLNSGYMVAQYTAAALVSENKVLSHPASVDSISVSADQEDHVSMGPIAVRKCTEILKNTGTVIAIEMICAAQAFHFRDPLKPGKGSTIANRLIREVLPPLLDDRPLYDDIDRVKPLVYDWTILEAVEKELGPMEWSESI